MEKQTSVTFLLQKLMFGNSTQNLHKNRYQKFSGLAQFYLIFSLLSKYFATDCLTNQIFAHNLPQSRQTSVS